MGEFVARWAKHYRDLGLMPIPLERGKKNPNTLEWQTLNYDTPEALEAQFAGDTNIGILLGAPSNGFIDVDLDRIEAVRLAPTFLPETDFKWGRPSKPLSHWGYRVPTDVRRVTFIDPLATDPKKAMMLEIRGTGLQSMIAPSIHPEGETIQMYKNGAIAEMDIETLRASCGYLAAATFLAIYWNKFGSRHTTAMQLAGALARSGWDEETTDRFITAVATAAFDEEIEDRRRTVRDTYLKQENDDPSTGWPTLRDTLGEEVVQKVRAWLGIKDTVRYEMNDMGNAQRFLTIHGEEIRFCEDMKVWLVWDGKRWKRDESGVLIGSRSHSVQRHILQEAAKEPDQRRAEALAKWALQTGFANRITAVETVAQDMPNVWIHSSQLDMDPFKLNVKNGTLNLITGGLERPHSKLDHMTYLAGVDYNPKAACPRFELFLETIMAKNQALIVFLQRLFGLCLTGSIDEQVFPIFFGHGANGKSTLLEIAKAVMGDYGQTADASTFLQQNSDRIRTDLARMKGARLVTASEIAQNRKLDTAMVKAVTGGEKISARFLFKNDFEYLPGYKVLMATNYKPVIQGDDEGMWRRLRLVPFEVRIPDDQQDKKLKQKIIETELEGVLAWMVQGCMDWQRYGLTTPPEVMAATAEYKGDSDTIKMFIDEGCVTSEGEHCTVKEIYTTYQLWCKASGERYMTSTQFRDKLESRGFQLRKGGKEWQGLSPISILSGAGEDFGMAPDPEEFVPAAGAPNPFAP